MAKKNWIKDATSNSKGQFRAKAEAAGESTKQFAQEHKSDPGIAGKQARLALNLMKSSNSAKTMRNKMYGEKNG